MRSSPKPPAFIFDLDGTLVDTVYDHVLAWREALEDFAIELPAWLIHRHIGMSGGLLVNALLRQSGKSVSHEEVEKLQKAHSDAYLKRAARPRTLPGARDLLLALTHADIRWNIATSGGREFAQPALRALEFDFEVPIVTRDEVERAKPDPDLFIVAAERLGADLADCVVVGDSVWDLLAARRAKALGVGLLCGGYSTDELERAGAYRVYQDPLDLLKHLDEVGIRILNGKG